VTTRPRLKIGAHLWRGLSALVLFGVFVLVFLGADFGTPAGFAGLESITATLGYALFDVSAESVESTGTEPFLVAFEIIDVVLVAALVGGVMLARREEAGEVVSALKSIGGDE